MIKQLKRKTTDRMYENHKNEQYFFSRNTIQLLCDALSGFNNICCLCTPTLGMELLLRGKTVQILDIDRRFERFEGFRYFNIARPQWLGEKYDIIVCDPPFFNISLSQLFLTLRTLSLNDFNQRFCRKSPFQNSPIFLHRLIKK